MINQICELIPYEVAFTFDVCVCVCFSDEILKNKTHGDCCSWCLPVLYHPPFSSRSLPSSCRSRLPPADNKDVSVMMSEMDVNAIAGTLKLYFRELPEPLFTDELYPNFAGGISKSLSNAG